MASLTVLRLFCSIPQSFIPQYSLKCRVPHIFSDFFFSSGETENILNIKKSAQHPKSFTNSEFLISLPLHFLSFEIPLVFSLIPISLALSMILLFPTLSDLLTNHVRYDIMYTHINTHTPASYTYIIENKYLSMGLILPW